MEHVQSTLSHELEIDWFSLLPQYAVAGVGNAKYLYYHFNILTGHYT